MAIKFTPEQIEKLKACQTAEEAKALAEEENIELTDEQLEDIIGGAKPLAVQIPMYKVLHCKNCGHAFNKLKVIASYEKCPKCGYDYTREKGDPTYDKLF